MNDETRPVIKSSKEFPDEGFTGKHYLISGEGERKLQELAEKWKMKPSEALDWLIKDRWSQSDKFRNGKRARKRFTQWVKKVHEREEHIDLEVMPGWTRYSDEQVFRMAYGMGYHDFQVRHEEHPPVIEVCGDIVFDKYIDLTPEQIETLENDQRVGALETHVLEWYPELYEYDIAYLKKAGQLKVLNLKSIWNMGDENDGEA
jgi:hypothetical protein